MDGYTGYWTDVYWDHFYKHLGDGMTQRAAWEAAEKWHFEKFEFNHYEDFESARQGMHYWHNKRRHGHVSKKKKPVSIKEKKVLKPGSPPGQLALF